MFFQPLFERIAQNPHSLSSILNEKTCSREIVYYTVVDGSLVSLSRPLMKVTHSGKVHVGSIKN